MDKISIHRALGELKLLDAKINKLINNDFIASKQASVDKVGGITVKDLERDMKANYQSLTDLINRRSKIKSAIIKSNVLTEVEINTVKMTVAEVIDEKTSIQYKSNLLNTLSQQYNKVIAGISKVNEEVNMNSEKFIDNLYRDKTQEIGRASCRERV